MLTQADRNRIAVNQWTARIIPLVLAGVVGYATYVTMALLCVNYLLVKHDNKGAAIPILVIYSILFILMTVTFIRLVYVTVFDPPYVPLGAAALRDRKRYKGKSKGKIGAEEKGIGTGEYDARNASGGTSPEFPEPNNDPDSPGLEQFYTKDVFVCEVDGRPIWCSQCSNWKPDRTHHDSSSGRCIRKMDHFCPWVGGPVGENNFKFFIQFNVYTALYCFHLLIIMAIYIHQEITTKGEDVNRHFCAILALATFFGLFTAGMVGTSLDLAANNQTQVETLGGKTKVHLLAVLKPLEAQLRRNKPPFAPEVAYREITYPLAADSQSNHHKARSNTTTTAHGNPPAPEADPSIGNFQLATEPENQPLIQLPHNLSVAGTATLSVQSNTDDFPETQKIAPHPAPGVVTSTAHQNQVQPSMESLSNLPPVIQGTTSSGPIPQCRAPLQINGRSAEVLSARDLQATRTFAILKMQPGENPWDLGSTRLNLQSVMGRGLGDWLLPIRRSPCCNHEDAESQFQVGPHVDVLRTSCYFITPNDIRLPKKIGKKSKWIQGKKDMHQPAHDPSLTGPNTVPMRDLPREFQRE